MILQEKIEWALGLSIVALGLSAANCFVMAIGLWLSLGGKGHR